MELRYECDYRWEDLAGESNMRRHCASCDQHVYNISNMTADQARRLIETYEGSGRRLCVNFVRRDGRIVHRGDPMEQLAQVESQRHGAAKLLATALLVHTGFAAFAENPKDYWMDPFKGAASAVSSVIDELTRKKPEGYTRDQVVTGVMF